ncbi:PKS-NRPS hybrid synthetase [Metarhizium anisopliae]|nr:PKS-NRPS hybrid synthetase [Metarhizium anisopliae]
MSHLYRLVEAIQGMLEDQEREFRQACALDEVLTAREHLGRGAEYLGELSQIVSQKALSLITRQYRKALKGIPSPANPWPDAMRLCDDDCTVAIELGIPCYHVIYQKLVSATCLTKWDIHPRWHLREPSGGDVYRRILDPKIATSLRGRPKNNAQPIPASHQSSRKLPEFCHSSSKQSAKAPRPIICKSIQDDSGQLHVRRRPYTKESAKQGNNPWVWENDWGAGKWTEDTTKCTKKAVSMGAIKR